MTKKQPTSGEMIARSLELRLAYQNVRPRRFPRLYKLLWPLLHPIAYYRYRKARKQALIAAQAVIDSYIDSFKKAVEFLEKLEPLTEHYHSPSTPRIDQGES